MTAKHTPAERVKASRLRAKLKRHDPISEANHAWLRAYDNATAEPADYTAPELIAPPTSSPDFKTLTFDEPVVVSPPPPVPHEVPACTIPDCPRCRDVDTALVCGATQLRVYPRMAASAAQAIAGVILAFCTIIARVMGRTFTPESGDSTRLGAAIATVAYRRASWTGGADDLLTLAFVVGGIGARIYSAPVTVVDTKVEE